MCARTVMWDPSLQIFWCPGQSEWTIFRNTNNTRLCNNAPSRWCFFTFLSLHRLGSECLESYNHCRKHLIYPHVAFFYPHLLVQANLANESYDVCFSLWSNPVVHGQRVQTHWSKQQAVAGGYKNTTRTEIESEFCNALDRRDSLPTNTSARITKSTSWSTDVWLGGLLGPSKHHHFLLGRSCVKTHLGLCGDSALIEMDLSQLVRVYDVFRRAVQKNNINKSNTDGRQGLSESRNEF